MNYTVSVVNLKKVLANAPRDERIVRIGVANNKTALVKLVKEADNKYDTDWDISILRSDVK
jgi:hypothetical protein